MNMQANIEHKLAGGLEITHLEVINESHQHNVPSGSESHFKVVIVSDAFQGRTLVARHKLVYGLLEAEMRDGIHALALHTYTGADWGRHQESVTRSPPCRGGSKHG